jgi:hypothetical protein
VYPQALRGRQVLHPLEGNQFSAGGEVTHCKE